MNHPLDFFDNDTALRDELTGSFPRPAPPAIEAVSRAYRALLEASADRTFTPSTAAAVRALHGLRGGPNRAMVEAALDGLTEITGQNGVDGDGKPVAVTVSLRQRSPKQQVANDLSVERAFDALRPAAIRFDQAHPVLAAHRRSVFLADDRADYDELLRLAVTPASRRAAAGVLGALGRTERGRAKATSPAKAA